MSNELKQLFEQRIADELYNHQVYKFFANRLKNIGLDNLAKFFNKQASDELHHYNILIDYCNQRNIDVEFLAIKSVEIEYVTLIDIARMFLKLEQNNTRDIKAMINVAMQEGDLLSYKWLIDDLLKEQIEEEDLAQTLSDKLINIGDDMPMIQIFDQGMEL